MSTINGFVVELTTQPSNTEVSFRLLGDVPVVVGVSWVRSATKRVRTDLQGFFSIVLAMGDYEMTVEDRSVTISVPNDSNSYNFAARIVGSAIYAPTTPAGVAAPNASASVAGLVRTNTNPVGIPVVYTKAEVDALLLGGAFFVPTFADMQAIPSSAANKYCECFGGSVDGDGNGGRYRWKAGVAPVTTIKTDFRPNDYNGSSPVGWWTQIA